MTGAPPDGERRKGLPGFRAVAHVVRIGTGLMGGGGGSGRPVLPREQHASRGPSTGHGPSTSGEGLEQHGGDAAQAAPHAAVSATVPQWVSAPRTAAGPGPHELHPSSLPWQPQDDDDNGGATSKGGGASTAVWLCCRGEVVRAPPANWSPEAIAAAVAAHDERRARRRMRRVAAASSMAWGDQSQSVPGDRGTTDGGEGNAVPKTSSSSRHASRRSSTRVLMSDAATSGFGAGWPALAPLYEACVSAFAHHCVDPRPASEETAARCLLLQPPGVRVAFECFRAGEARPGSIVHFLPHRASFVSMPMPPMAALLSPGPDALRNARAMQPMIVPQVTTSVAAAETYEDNAVAWQEDQLHPLAGVEDDPGHGAVWPPVPGLTPPPSPRRMQVALSPPARATEPALVEQWARSNGVAPLGWRGDPLDGDPVTFGGSDKTGHGGDPTGVGSVAPSRPSFVVDFPAQASSYSASQLPAGPSATRLAPAPITGSTSGNTSRPSGQFGTSSDPEGGPTGAKSSGLQLGLDKAADRPPAVSERIGSQLTGQQGESRSRSSLRCSLPAVDSDEEYDGGGDDAIEGLMAIRPKPVQSSQLESGSLAHLRASQSSEVIGGMIFDDSPTPPGSDGGKSEEDELGSQGPMARRDNPSGATPLEAVNAHGSRGLGIRLKQDPNMNRATGWSDNMDSVAPGNKRGSTRSLLRRHERLVPAALAAKNWAGGTASDPSLWMLPAADLLYLGARVAGPLPWVRLPGATGEALYLHNYHSDSYQSDEDRPGGTSLSGTSRRPSSTGDRDSNGSGGRPLSDRVVSLGGAAELNAVIEEENGESGVESSAGGGWGDKLRGAAGGGTSAGTGGRASTHEGGGVGGGRRRNGRRGISFAPQGEEDKDGGGSDRGWHGQPRRRVRGFSSASDLMGRTTGRNGSQGSQGRHSWSEHIDSGREGHSTVAGANASIAAAAGDGSAGGDVRHRGVRGQVGTFFGPRVQTERQLAVWTVLSDPTSSLVATASWLVITIAILVSTAVFVVETSQTYYSPDVVMSSPFFIIESICVCIFLVEIVLRVWSVPSLGGWISDPMSWLDVIAVLPWFIDVALTGASTLPGLSIVRIFRLARALRLLRLNQSSMAILFTALQVSWPVLNMLVLLLSMTLVILSSLVWFAERGVVSDGHREWISVGIAPFTCDIVLSRPEGYDWSSFEPDIDLARGCREGGPPELRVDPVTGLMSSLAPFQCPALQGTSIGAVQAASSVCKRSLSASWAQSIPHSMWLGLATFSTVGYGDVVPTTVVGRLIGSIQLVVGILTVAMPTTVIQSNFHDVLAQVKAREEEEREEELKRLAAAKYRKRRDKIHSNKRWRFRTTASFSSRASLAGGAGGGGGGGGAAAPARNGGWSSILRDLIRDNSDRTDGAGSTADGPAGGDGGGGSGGKGPPSAASSQRSLASNMSGKFRGGKNGKPLGVLDRMRERNLKKQAKARIQARAIADVTTGKAGLGLTVHQERARALRRGAETETMQDNIERLMKRDSYQELAQRLPRSSEGEEGSPSRSQTFAHPPVPRTAAGEREGGIARRRGERGGRDTASPDNR